MLRAYSKSAGPGKRRSPSAAPRTSVDYAHGLLTTFGDLPCDPLSIPERHPVLAAAAAGLMALTGSPDGPPVATPGDLAACARGALAALAALAESDRLAALDAAALLGERAAVLGLSRRGTTSAGGHCRLLRARDGWVAVNLPRAEDVATVPAWLEHASALEHASVLGHASTLEHASSLEPASSKDAWDVIGAVAARRGARPLVARARLLGLAAAEAARPADRPPPWCRLAARGTRVVATTKRAPLVVDLSSLWAGPLATHLLHLAGARVVKVESTRRPDGGRRGPAAFFDLLHAGKESVALDFTSPTGRRALVALIARADVVIESARPRAMEQLGIDPAALVRARPGLTWISITGYGRRGPAARWVAFGDDAGAAAGLATATGTLAGGDTPLFCADAVPDPLTGMHAAVAALGAHRRGGGVLLALSLRDVAAQALAFAPTTARAEVRSRAEPDGVPAWEVAVGGERQPVAAPRARPALGPARPLGADTDAVLRELDVR